MERERGLPASRKPAVESATTWIIAMIGLAVIAGLLVVTVAPPGGEDTNGPSTSAEQVVPNTPPPVRTE